MDCFLVKPGGGAPLNFKVTGNPQPANPKENTIWVNTDVPIGAWYFSVSQPENMAEGDVWFYSGTAGSIAFNALKKNGIQVCPFFAKQYVNGALVERIAKCYQDGEWLTLGVIPKFTYTGEYEIVNDEDQAISTSQANWKIRFLTSGTLTFTALNSAAGGIDVFCVGGGGGGARKNDSHGGGGGGGGGRTVEKNIVPEVNIVYSIVVGAGGGVGSSGGQTSAFEVTANGGNSSNGQGGGYGGSNGGYGTNAESGGGAGGAGGAEFGEDGATLYGGGGGGGTNGDGAAGGAGGGGAGGGWGYSGKNGTTNTGGGGGGYGNLSNSSSGSGGSGIVIIRNARG